MVSYESFYSGGNYPTDPKYGSLFTGYRSMFADIGTSMDARTANQIKETSKHLNTGLKVFEVAAHSAEVFDAIPQEQLTEINRLSRLTGSEATMHAPMIDPTGITQQGYSKMLREAAEKQLWNAIDRSHALNPKGNIVVTMHASTTQLPSAEQLVKKTEDGKPEVVARLLVDPQGGLHEIREKEAHYFPTENTKAEDIGKGTVKFNVDYEAQKQNRDIWQNKLTDLAFNTYRGKQEIDHVLAALPGSDKYTAKDWEEVQKENPEIPQLDQSLSMGSSFLKGAYISLQQMYDLAYHNAKGQDKEKLDDFSREVLPYVKEFDKAKPEDLKKFASIIEKGHNILTNMKPEILTPLRSFAIEKSAETVSNIALQSYKKFKDTSPVISLENHPAYQSLLTTGGDLKDVIEKARNDFVDKAEKDGISRSEAKKAAEKIIGATWDVGHINMLRKFGFGDKEIIEETKKVSKFVKHVHLSDNFGMEHTELPMGMGNVPIKEIMSQLGKDGFKGKKVVEALSWWQHFSEQGVHHAIVPTMQAMGSPVYGMANGPYWNQVAGANGNYFGMPMTYLPEKHFSTYGSGFSSLPEELGGQIPGTQSRFSGAPSA